MTFDPFLLKTSGVLASTALGNDLFRATQLQVECGASGRWSETEGSRAVSLWKCTISGHAAPGEFGGLKALAWHLRLCLQSSEVDRFSVKRLLLGLGDSGRWPWARDFLRDRT